VRLARGHNRCGLSFIVSRKVGGGALNRNLFVSPAGALVFLASSSGVGESSTVCVGRGWNAGIVNLPRPIPRRAKLDLATLEISAESWPNPPPKISFKSVCSWSSCRRLQRREYMTVNWTCKIWAMLLRWHLQIWVHVRIETNKFYATNVEHVATRTGQQSCPLVLLLMFPLHDHDFRTRVRPYQDIQKYRLCVIFRKDHSDFVHSFDFRFKGKPLHTPYFCAVGGFRNLVKGQQIVPDERPPNQATQEQQCSLRLSKHLRYRTCLNV